MRPRLAPEIKETLDGRWEPVYRSQLHYLVTWATRGRKPVLKDRHAALIRDLVEHTCEERGHPALEVVSGSDHVHVLMALRPSESIASVVRELKGKTAMALMEQYPELRVWLRGNLAWDERYAVETVSAARVDRVRERLRVLHHDPNERLARAS